MVLLGHEVTWDACYDKWRAMLRTYKNIVDRKKQSGSAKSTCAYFKEMDDILGKDPNIRPPVTYNSSNSAPCYRGK